MNVTEVFLRSYVYNSHEVICPTILKVWVGQGEVMWTTPKALLSVGTLLLHNA
jgi:hypothetical protein